MEGGSRKHQHLSVWQTWKKGSGRRGGRQTEGGRRRGKRQTGRAKASPHVERRHLVKPVHRSHRQMLSFFYDNGRPAKQLAASRSFEQPLTSKLSPGFTPAPVPTRYTRKGLVGSWVLIWAWMFQYSLLSNAEHEFSFLFWCSQVCERPQSSVSPHVSIRCGSWGFMITN